MPYIPNHILVGVHKQKGSVDQCCRGALPVIEEGA
jgi:hypothetical protein